jgi:hypothetical protein
MARFCCRACCSEGSFTYWGKHECPKCGSNDVQFALSTEELGDDDLIFVISPEMNETNTED